jgi:hypothetical protein
MNLSVMLTNHYRLILCRNFCSKKVTMMISVTGSLFRE